MSKKRSISDDNLEAIILNDIKEMDKDALVDLIQYMYPVEVENNEDESYTINSTDDNMSVEDIFGEKNSNLFETK